jgi:hypothetical protein
MTSSSLAALHEDIQYVTLLIDRAPQIVLLALDRQKHLIHMPLVAKPRTTATELISILLAKFATPLANRLIGHADATLKQELFDIPEAQAEAKVQPYCVANNLHRKAVVLIFGDSGQYIHAATLTRCVGVQQVDDAPIRYPWNRVIVCMRF